MSTVDNIYNQIFSCESKEQKKELLVLLPSEIKKAMELGECECENVNAGLLDIYTNKEHRTFETFHNWKKKGFKVKKGSKAFFIWSKPMKSKKNNTNEESKDVDKEKDQLEKQYKFYAMAYLFSNAQVEPLL